MESPNNCSVDKDAVRVGFLLTTGDDVWSLGLGLTEGLLLSDGGVSPSDGGGDGSTFLLALNDTGGGGRAGLLILLQCSDFLFYSCSIESRLYHKSFRLFYAIK